MEMKLQFQDFVMILNIHIKMILKEIVNKIIVWIEALN